MFSLFSGLEKHDSSRFFTFPHNDTLRKDWQSCNKELSSLNHKRPRRFNKKTNKTLNKNGERID